MTTTLQRLMRWVVIVQVRALVSALVRALVSALVKARVRTPVRARVSALVKRSASQREPVSIKRRRASRLCHEEFET
jgi:hypothetical protein